MENKYLVLLFFWILMVETRTESTTDRTTTITAIEDDEIATLKLTFDELQKIVVTDEVNNETDDDSISSTTPQARYVSSIKSDDKKLLPSLKPILTIDELQKLIATDEVNDEIDEDSTSSTTPQTSYVSNSNIQSDMKKILATFKTTVSTENYSSTGETKNFGFCPISGMRIENPSNQNDSVISNVSKLLKGMLPNGFKFGSPGQDSFGFMREHTTKAPKHAIQSQKCFKKHGILFHKKRSGNRLNLEDYLKGKVVESIIDGTESGSCGNCSNILIFINRNNNTINGSKSTETAEVKSVKPDEIAIIETVLQSRMKQSPSSSETNKVIKNLCESNPDSHHCDAMNEYENAVTSMNALPDESGVPTNNTDNAILINMQPVKDRNSQVNPNTKNNTCGNLEERILKSIDVDLKCKQQWTVTGSLKLNYS